MSESESEIIRLTEQVTALTERVAYYQSKLDDQKLLTDYFPHARKVFGKRTHEIEIENLARFIFESQLDPQFDDDAERHDYSSCHVALYRLSDYEQDPIVFFHPEACYIHFAEINLETMIDHPKVKQIIKARNKEFRQFAAEVSKYAERFGLEVQYVWNQLDDYGFFEY